MSDPQIQIHPPDSLGKRLLMVMQAITTVGAIAALVLVILSSHKESNDTKALVLKLQQQRYQAQYNSCQSTNARHDATVHRFLIVFQQEEQNPPPGFTHKDLEANLQGNLFLIQAFEPRTVAGKGSITQRENQGCKNFAFAQTHPKLSKAAKKQQVTTPSSTTSTKGG